MKEFLSAIDNLPKIAKIILCLPVIDIIWAIYRIVKGIDTSNTVLIVVGILWIVFGSTITWVADLIGTILNDKPWLTE